ncbi:hypothetical protein [Embleya sp. NPDC001921]
MANNPDLSNEVPNDGLSIIEVRHLGGEGAQWVYQARTGQISGSRWRRIRASRTDCASCR